MDRVVESIPALRAVVYVGVHHDKDRDAAGRAREKSLHPEVDVRQIRVNKVRLGRHVLRRLSQSLSLTLFL